MIDTTGKSLWQLIEERAALTPGQADGDRRAGPHAHLRRVQGAGPSGSPPASPPAASTAGTNVSWVLPTRHRVDGARRRARPPRRGAEPDPADLPPPRGRLHRPPDRAQAADRPRHVPRLRLPDDGGASSPPTVDTEVLVADPDLPEGDPSTLGAPAPDGRRRHLAAALDLLLVGHDRRPEGRQAHRPQPVAPPTTACSGRCEVTGADRAAVVFPITHVGGLVWLFNAMETGVELLMVEAFNPQTTPTFLAEHGVTCAGAGTAFWLAYLARPAQAAAARRCSPRCASSTAAGRPSRRTLHHEMLDRDGRHPLIGGWGLTESPINTMVHVDDPDVKKAETDGRACPAVQHARRVTRRRELRRRRGGRAARRRPAGVPRLRRRVARRRRVRRRRLVPHRRPRRRSTTTATCASPGG